MCEFFQLAQNFTTSYIPGRLDPARTAATLDQAHLLNLLHGVSLPGWDSKRVDHIQVSVLKLHEGKRCTVLLLLQAKHQSYELIGKIYAEDRADLYQAMQAVQCAGFQKDAELSIPQPIAYLPRLQLLLQEKVEGDVASATFLSDDERVYTKASERCGRWLAAFHLAAPKFERSGESAFKIASLERWFRTVAKLGPTLADKARRLFEGLENSGARLPPVEKRASHGSYSPSQVIFAQGRTVVFDWDGYGFDDPARDVARFIVGLWRLALGRLRSIRARDSAVLTFKKTYLNSGGADVEPRLRFYEAAICLQLAKYSVSHRVRGWDQKLEAMLDEGLRILEREE